MEPENLNEDVNGLISFIKGEYKAKADTKFLLLVVVALFVGVLISKWYYSSSVQEFIHESGLTLFLFVMVTISLVKDRFYFQKMGQSENAPELLATYDKYVKTDRVFLAVFLPILLLMVYFKHGFYSWTFFIIGGLILLIGIIFFFMNPYNDKNIKCLRELVEQQN